MCGIVGYIGSKNATPILVNALKKLEYRGYDSAGIAVFSGEDIAVRKSKGALKELEKQLAKDSVQGLLGIGHTRWATHGEPSDINAHPHTNLSGTIAVVHNGIIENYAKLKAQLQSEGVVFKSQTDTEVIAHLINRFYEADKNIFNAVRDALKKLEGSYALGVISSDYPDRIIACRKESPLIVGLGEGENFIASDVPAVLAHTREVYFLEQNQIAVLYRERVDLFDEDGNRVIKTPSHIDWDIAAAEKNGFAHFMIKEIHEQPKAIRDTLRSHIVQKDGGKDIVFDELDVAKIDWKNANRVIITACGTAYNAGLVAKYAFERFSRLSVVVEVASEFRYENPVLFKNDIFITLSQSGETADTLAALRQAKSSALHVIAITNCVGSTISREANSVIYTLAGPEIAVASTKAYTTQLVCLYLLALKCAKERGSISDEDFSSMIDEIEAIPEKIEEILKNQNTIQKFASLNFSREKVFFIGRQFDSASTFEAALKLKEVSYMHSEAFAAGELKHGPIALVDSGTLCVAIATDCALYEKIASNIVEVKSRGCTALSITQDENSAVALSADEVFLIPAVRSEFAPLLTIIPSQLFAYYCSVLRGIDPDKPRNLAKSVTVE